MYQCTSHFTESKLRLKSFYNLPKVMLMSLDSELKAVSLNQVRFVLCLSVIQPFLLARPWLWPPGGLEQGDWRKSTSDF